jgi:hypothetical protein
MRKSIRHVLWGALLCVLSVSNWTGCGAEQGPDCRAFVACVAQLDALESTQTNVSRLLSEGAYWGRGDYAD